MYTVYSIVNTKTGDSYIGSTQDFNKRMSVHMSRVRDKMGNRNSSAPLYHNIRQYGLGAFIVNKLIEFSKERDARDYEAELIEDLLPSLNVRSR